MPKKNQKKTLSKKELGVTPFYKQPLLWMIVIIILLIVGSVLAFNLFRQQKTNYVDNSAATASSKAAKISPAQRMATDAHYFGNLTTQDLQSNPQKYIVNQSGNNTVYVWRVSDGETLVRFDDNDSNQVTVYKYAQNTEEMLQNQLYQTTK